MDSALVQVLLNAGIAGVFCLLFILGIVFPRSVVQDLKDENKELKDAVEAERDRANTAISVAAATRDVLTAIQVGKTTEGHGP